MLSAAVHPVLLVLGAGSNVGANVARIFAKNGYKVAISARRLQNHINADGYLHVHSDLTDPASVTSAFEKVSTTFGPPSVVIYNGSCPTLVVFILKCD